MQTVELSTEARPGTGKEKTRKIRQAERIPAAVYGGKKTWNLSVPYFEFMKHYSKNKHSNVFYVLSLPEAGLQIKTLIKEIQVHPVSQKVTHIDFYELTAGKKIRTKIAVKLNGSPVGVKEGGILEHFVWDVQVECLPEDLIDAIELDVSPLNIGDAVHVRDLKVTDKIRLLDNADEIVVTIGLPAKEEEVAATAAAVPAEGAAAAAVPGAPGAAPGAPAAPGAAPAAGAKPGAPAAAGAAKPGAPAAAAKPAKK
jgi:large subunit ribosomal protein L25